MKKMNALLLGWEFPPAISGEIGNSCFNIAKFLANRINLSLILPKSDPEFILKNVDLTGLNNMDLSNTEAGSATGESQYKVAKSPFSEVVPTTALPLYGAPTPTQESTEEVPQAKPQAGEMASVGHFALAEEPKTISQEVEELYVFGQRDLSLVDYNSQVIHYARYVSRLASQKQYDVIYAYDWMTFLAGIELKLVSGKPLVLHMHSLSSQRGGPDSKAWVYELEKQALGKADAVIAINDHIRLQIMNDYDVPASKITPLNIRPHRKEEPAAEHISTEIYNIEVSESNNDLVKSMLPVKEETDPEWEDAARIVWQVLEEVTYEPDEVEKED